MQAAAIIGAIEAFAPLPYQESYDNSGLQVGDTTTEISGVLLTLDFTEAVLREAMSKNCNMIIAHHPIIFSGLKRLTGKTYVERIVQMAIKHDLVLYAAHTNLDNVRAGVNDRIARKLGLRDTRILSAKTDTLSKLYTYVPPQHAAQVRDALFAAGAGDIGRYSECSFNSTGTGTFRPDPDADPLIGTAGGPREETGEIRIEVLVPRHLCGRVVQALMASHPYEEVAYELIALHNSNQDLGAGMTGRLPQAMDGGEFLAYLKERMKTGCIRHTALPDKKIERVALCGGSGSFLLKEAMAAGADVFITADYKYHQFFDADGQILIADIGHYESEQFTAEIMEEVLKKKFPNFAILLSTISTNPVNYYH